MVWPCKQNASGKTPHTSFTCQSKWEMTIGRPRTGWTDYIEDLGWNRLGLRPSEMMNVMEDRKMWQPNLKCSPCNAYEKASNKKRTKQSAVICFKEASKSNFGTLTVNMRKLIDYDCFVPFFHCSTKKILLSWKKIRL